MTEILHASLLKGTLSIQVSDTDIRRTSTGTSAVSLGSSAIETDYILCITPTRKVKFSSTEKKLSTGSLQVGELKTYHCSKRYVDLRHLAKSMQEHAVEVVNFHVKKSDSSSSVLGTSGTLVKSAKEFAHFITNTEKNSSNVATDLDSLFQQQKSGSDRAQRRTSAVLNEGAPIYIRKVLEGVDDFFQCIYSEKRQFSGKKNLEYVKKVAERRKGIINEAFEKFLNALAEADLDQQVKLHEMPQSMMELVKCVEKFLLTDVVEDNNLNADVVEEKSDQQHQSSGSLSSEDYVDVTDSPSTPPHDAEPTKGRPTMVKAMSTRNRMSFADRKEEEKECALAQDLVIAESVEEKESPRQKKIESSPPPKEGLLPDDPIEFGIIVAIGAIFFKLVQGRSMELQIDVLSLFGMACGLIGYQLAAGDCDKNQFIDDGSEAAKRVTIAEPTPAESRQRPSLTKSGRSMMLITRTLSRRISSFGKEKDDEPEQAVALKTFEMFPPGAKIGSHLNCWSSPPSTNFNVRGPNYLVDKMKVPSGDFLFPTRGCDLFLTDNAPVNVGRYDGILNGKLREKPTFIINYRLPWGVFISYHEIPEKFLPFLRKKHGYGNSTEPLPSMEGMSAGEQAMCNFLLSDSEEKDEVLKIVPMVVEGPWVVKRVVGGKPAIIGTKLPISYVYQPPEKGLCEYLEADLDIVSSAAARNILAVVRSYTQVLTIDIGFVIQGNKEQHLPEQMMMGLRCHGLDPLTAELLPESPHDIPHLIDDDGEDSD